MKQITKRKEFENLNLGSLVYIKAEYSWLNNSYLIILNLTSTGIYKFYHISENMFVDIAVNSLIYSSDNNFGIWLVAE